MVKGRSELVKSPAFQRNFLFAVVKDKLVWFSFNQKTVWHLDNILNIAPGKVNWALTACKGFTVNEITSDFTKEAFIKKTLHLTELPSQSVQQIKHMKQHDRTKNLL